MAAIARLASSAVWFWLLLSVPALPMLWALSSSGTEAAERLLHPTGEFAARFLILALAITPLRLIFPNAGWLRWLARRRRAVGVAAFGYAALHTVLYIVDTATLREMWAEFFALGIWTGWAAVAIFIPLAVTSNDAAQRLLRRGWGRLHRLVYGAAILTLLHWIFIHNNLGPALVHFVPLAGLEAYRLFRRFRRDDAGTEPDARLERPV